MKETLSMILPILCAEIISGMRGFVRAASLAALLCGAQATASTNFFRAATVDGRDWIVAPDGSRQLFLGIDHVRPFGWKDRTLGFDVYGRFVETNYPSKEAWLDETLGRLGDWGFNTLANHCDEPLLRHRGLAHTITLYLGGKFARGKDPDRWITKWTGPCTGFPNVFHPDFERVIRERARELCAPHRDDPDLMGWFLDNELKWWGSADKARKDLTLFDTVRALPPEHTARKALESFLATKNTKGHKDFANFVSFVAGNNPGNSANPVENSSAHEPDNQIREAFLRLVADRYFSVLCAAIREADPNHMILGCRFAAPFTATHPVLWEVAGRHCDIVSFNCYPWADIDRGVVLDEKGGIPVADRFRDIHGWCGKPLVVTEWSFPALDTGRPCFHGAGQRFPTQEGRAAATALYARTLLSLPFVAGYSYFMFLDQPRSGISQTFREDSNYGLVDEFGKPYEAVTAALREVQRDAVAVHNCAQSFAMDNCQKQATANSAAIDVDGTKDPLSFGSCEPLSQLSFANHPADGCVLSNAFVRLEGVGDGRPRLVLGDVEVGCLGALLQWRGPNGDVWTHAEKYAFLDPTPHTIMIRAVGGEDVRFAIAIRASLAPDARLLDVEILSVENLSDEPIRFSGVFLVPMPPAGAEPEPVVPNLWGAPERAWWRNPDGAVWGAVSDSPSARFRFWDTLHGKKDGAVHADARFTTGPTPVVLAPGETWCPPSRMSAAIGLRDDFPETAK